jgi:hypothetical protein
MNMKTYTHTYIYLRDLPDLLPALAEISGEFIEENTLNCVGLVHEVFVLRNHLSVSAMHHVSKEAYKYKYTY